jgi:hypothetical protein
VRGGPAAARRAPRAAPIEQRIADSVGAPIEQDRSGLSHLVNVGVDPLGNDDPILVANQRLAPDELAAHRPRIRPTEVALALRASAAGNEPSSRLNFLAGSASLFVAEWTTLPHGQG